MAKTRKNKALLVWLGMRLNDYKRLKTKEGKVDLRNDNTKSIMLKE